MPAAMDSTKAVSADILSAVVANTTSAKAPVRSETLSPTLNSKSDFGAVHDQVDTGVLFDDQKQEAMRHIIVSAFLLTMSSSCCFMRQDSYEPPYPQHLKGWKYHEEDGVGIVGEFVLRKRESTNNDRILIKVVDLLPADTCADQGDELAKRRAKIQFIRSSDNVIVCEQVFPIGGGNLCGNALQEFRINGIGIRDISIKNQWVHFILTGAEN